MDRTSYARISILSLAAAALPYVTFGVQDVTGNMPSDFKGVIGYALSILNLLLPILFALSFIIFFWGLSKFILSSSGSPADIQKGKNYMMWGILALFILVSARTLISLASNDLEFGPAKTVPSLPEK
jgi:hypothetical protein